VDVAVVVPALGQLVVEVERFPKRVFEGQTRLLVVAVVERTIGNAHQGLHIMSLRVLLVALKDGQGGHEVPFLEECRNVRQLVLLLNDSETSVTAPASW
jgi:hypothetical protein